ncbi:MAG: hypothetical protein LBV79_10435 [Candidatus Adiutrix sp.]|nr:hypothetical protein [Candidatus Adiutrix sp.]
MMTAQDIREMNDLSVLLASGLTMNSETAGLPLEVSQALAEAREQMAGLPEVIENLNLAFERFHTVSSALGRMIELADQASGDMDAEAREPLNQEFVNLAKILAADAGRQYYAGPRLNLLNQGEALSAARIIRYMNPVIDNMGQELTGQRDLIHEVLGETINFLGVVTQCYPDSIGAVRLGELISQAAARGNISAPAQTPARLH